MKRLFVVLSIFVALSIVGLAIASPARQGSFPETGILDDFNRADEGPPPSANWTMIEGSAGVSSNQAASIDPESGANAIWSIESFGPDCEVYATIPVTPSNGGSINLFARLNNPTFPTAGYALWIIRDDNDVDHLILNNLSTNLISLAIDWQDGDSFGLRLISSTIQVLYKPSGLSWTELDSVVDSSTTNAGYLGFYLNDLVTRLDNFGGGEITVAEPTPTPTITPTGGITSTIPYVVVPIPGGQAQPAIYVVYSLTIGEIITAAVMLLLVLVISGRWLYDVAMDVFQVRNAAIGSWVSRKLYKRWVNRMVE